MVSLNAPSRPVDGTCGPRQRSTKPVGVAVGADLAAAVPHALVGIGGVDRPDDLDLVGLVGEQLQALLDRVLLADEGLVLGDDLPHARFDPAQVVLAEMAPAGQLEVVVEAVLDRRPDGVVGARPQVGHRLGQHVGGGVAQNVAAGLGAGGDEGHLAPSGSSVSRSQACPSTSTATAARARPGPMAAARSPPVDPAGSCRGESSGR